MTYTLDIHEYVNESTVGEQLLKDIKETFYSHGFTDDDIRRLVFVIDEGGNLRVALEQGGYEFIFCACHLCNTMAKRSLTPYKKRFLPNEPELHVETPFLDRLDQINETIAYTKKLIKAVR